MSDPDKPSPAMIQVRRLSHDYVQRTRVAMASTEAKLLEHLGRDTVEFMAEAMCEKLGIRYLPPPDMPRRNDGRASPWARKQSKAPKETA